MNTYNTAQMGYGEADITPETDVELVGFSRSDNHSKGIRDPLKLQTMVWEYGEETACLITLDSLGFTVHLSNVLRGLIADLLHTGPEHVMTAFSHTHSAPNAAEEREYFDFVCRRAQGAVKDALSSLSPAFAAWGIGENTVGLNRRPDSSDFDNRLGILSVTAPDSGAPRLLLLRVTAHANILSSDNYLISADYFGITRERLEAYFGCKIMIIQGAAGDVRPRFHQENTEYLEIHGFEAAEKGFSDEYQKRYCPQSRRALEQTAESICQAAAAVLPTMKAGPVTRLAIRSVFSRFAADVPSLSLAKRIADEARQEAGIDGEDWLREVKRLTGEGISQQFSDMEIQYLLLNDGCLCGIANEAMCRISMDAADAAGTRLLFLNGYTNGCSSYLPTAEEYDKGGYEVLWSNLVYFPYHGRVMPFNRNTAEQLVKKVAEDWKWLLLQAAGESPHSPAPSAPAPG